MPAVVQGGALNIRTSRQVGADLEILRSKANADLMTSIVLDASAVTADTDGVLRLKAGTLLTKNSNGQYQRYTGATPNRTSQTLVINAGGGTYTMTHGGQTTAAVAYNATAAEVEAALEALGNLGDVEVTGSGSAGDPYVITITNPTEQSALTTTATSLTGGASTATVGVVTPAIRGVLATTHEFPDNLSHSDAQSQMWNHGQQFRADRIVDWSTHGAAARAAMPTCQFE